VRPKRRGGGGNSCFREEESSPRRDLLTLLQKRNFLTRGEASFDSGV